MPARCQNPGLLLAALIFSAGSAVAFTQQPQVTAPQTIPVPTSPAPNATNPAVPAETIASPIAIVPVEGVELAGALNVADGKAVIGKSGTITAGKHTATVTLPHRGELYLCATSKVNLTTDSSVPASNTPGDPPGLMMAIDKGALEAKFATGKNSDVVLTPDFRILISGPGVADIQIRLGQKGDTCVDNSGPDAPYVAVSSVFDGGVYRVQAGQRVMFQHGSLTEVVDNERESCGCPPEPPTIPTGNQFPVAQSAGLAPVLPSTLASGDGTGGSSAQAHATLTHNSGEPASAADTTTAAVKPAPAPGNANTPTAAVTSAPSTPATNAAPTANPAAPAKPAAVLPPATLADAAADAAKPAPKPKNMGPAHRFGRFLRRLFGG